MQFSDGMKFDTSGPLRIESRSDGLYVVGGGMLCAVESRKDGETMIRQSAERKAAREAAKAAPMIKKTTVIKLPETITLKVGDATKTVATADYVRAKTKDLRAFGYASLEEGTVREQLHVILRGGKPSVIGLFMADEIQAPAK